MHGTLTFDLLSPYVGKHFFIRGCSVCLTLASAELMPRSAGPDTGHIPFTLLFHGPGSDPLPAGTYQAAAGSGLVFELHIMPIHTVTAERQDYQAVFN